MQKLSLTVVIAARNEAANLGRCLASLGPAARVVVVDSNSSDATCEIAIDAGAEVVQFQHRGGYPKKRQWALDTFTFDTQWVLLLDADEVIPDALWREIANAIGQQTEGVNGYLIRKGFHFLGRAMRYGGFSHNAVILMRSGKGRFESLIEVPGDTFDMEVHERVIIDGDVGVLKTPLIHEDFKGLEAYIDRHNRYSTWEAWVRHLFLKTGSYGQESIQAKLTGNSQERRRWLKRIAIRIPFESWLWFFYHYIFRMGFLEGRPGLIACQIRRQYIANVRAKMFEIRNKDA